MSESEKRITFSEAVKRDGLPEAKLAGHCARDALEDPHVIDRNAQGEYELLDDWRLRKFSEKYGSKNR